jgi:hypothetical protein
MIYHNYVHTKNLNLNLEEIRTSCDYMHALVSKNFVVLEKTGNQLLEEQLKPYWGNAPASTRSYGSYNLLLFPYNGFHKLYEEIRTTFREIVPEGNYYIQCWLNSYKKGEFIDWHGHWQSEYISWHGFYCVDVEPSKTTYRIQGFPDLEVNSEDDLLVLSPSGKDEHRTWPWHDETRPRITIAFDIVPGEFLDPTEKHNFNHWIPI